MRLAVLSDTHGNAVAFEAVIQDLRRQSPDAIVFLGDLVMRGPQPAECMELLLGLQPLAAVRGNHDHYFSRYRNAEEWEPKHEKGSMNRRQFIYNQALLSEEQLQWLREMPDEYVFRTGGFQAECYHAAPHSRGKIVMPNASDEELEALHQYEGTNMVLYGHIHHAYTQTVRGVILVNSGSVGLPFDGDPRASYAVIDIEGPDVSVQIRRVTYDREKVIRIAKDRGMPDLDLFEAALRKARFSYGLSKKENSSG